MRFLLKIIKQGKMITADVSQSISVYFSIYFTRKKEHVTITYVRSAVTCHEHDYHARQVLGTTEFITRHLKDLLRSTDGKISALFNDLIRLKVLSNKI